MLDDQKYNTLLDNMTQTYKQLAGCNPEDASDIGIRLKVVAHELTEIWQNLDIAKTQLFPQSSSGQYLDMHSQTRGIVRKQASYSIGNAMFYRDETSDVDIIIPKDTIVSTSGISPIKYKTSKDSIITAGNLLSQAEVVCQQSGSIGNIAVDTLSVIVTPVAGISGVRNEDMFTFGTDIEQDDQLRKRLFDSYQIVNNGTNTGFYYHKAMSYEGITSVYVIPRVTGVGTVEVVLDSRGTTVSHNMLGKIKQELDNLKEINVDVTVSIAIPKIVDIDIQISPSDGFTFQQAQEETIKQVNSVIDNAEVGKPIYISQIVKSILCCEKVENCKITSPNDDIRSSNRQIIRLGTLTVGKLAVL